MPIYAMKCKCGHEEDIYRSISQMNNDLPVHCGEIMQRKIVAPMVSVDIQPYKSMITGEMINSRSQHRAHLKAHNCVEVGNEKIEPSKPVSPPPGLKETLINVVNQKLK